MVIKCPKCGSLVIPWKKKCSECHDHYTEKERVSSYLQLTKLLAGAIALMILIGLFLLVSSSIKSQHIHDLSVQIDQTKQVLEEKDRIIVKSQGVAEAYSKLYEENRLLQLKYTATKENYETLQKTYSNLVEANNKLDDDHRELVGEYNELLDKYNDIVDDYNEAIDLLKRAEVAFNLIDTQMSILGSSQSSSSSTSSIQMGPLRTDIRSVLVYWSEKDIPTEYKLEGIAEKSDVEEGYSRSFSLSSNFNDRGLGYIYRYSSDSAAQNKFDETVDEVQGKRGYSEVSVDSNCFGWQESFVIMDHRKIICIEDDVIFGVSYQCFMTDCSVGNELLDKLNVRLHS